ncbi:hypothetical protein CEXT_375521 [Caerostris extrusa]|uniref:Uncharacterized protein n=1 Tax=Caerostris extrusa TaxID=172846 RepID=A0AAV4NW55_CAEEX|nr:hypothetical protein CEXT_375521 [Caerostris extrusa]
MKAWPPKSSYERGHFGEMSFDNSPIDPRMSSIKGMEVGKKSKEKKPFFVNNPVYQLKKGIRSLLGFSCHHYCRSSNDRF